MLVEEKREKEKESVVVIYNICGCVLLIFFSQVEANKDQFRQCVLHNDMNSNNFLVVEKEGKKQFSVLDFGDMVHSWLPIEVSVIIINLHSQIFYFITRLIFRF